MTDTTTEPSPDDPNCDPAFGDSVRKGLCAGLHSVVTLSKVMIPVYVLVAALQQTPLLPALARSMKPAMGLLGLPGEAAAVLAAGYVVNLYAAIAAMVPLGLSPREVTILGLILGLSHGLVLETAVIRKVCPLWGRLLFLRLVTGLVAGALVQRVMP